uniref:GYF domain-containing protein n=1 Tax=Noccaea caerulescens TaxID=107243 RepID=A0A1J3EUJ1_NOCCA
MEEKVRSLHEDVTKHWIARELALLQRRINQANEKGWRRELSQYLEKRELLTNPEEQSRLLCEVPEVVAEELEPQCVDDGVKIEDDFMEPNPVAYIEAHQSDDEEQQPSDSPVHSIQKNLENDFMESNSVTFVEAHQSEEEQQLSDSPVDTVQKNLENSKLRDGEDQPSRAASADDKDRRGDAEEQPESGIITENKESTTENVPQIEIIELSDDDDEDNDNGDYEQCDPKKVMWCYEQPKGRTNGPFSLAQLKEWNDEEYFVQVPDFKVWMTGKGMRSAVLLTKLLHHIKA